MTLPSVAIVIPTCNRPEPLKRCLRQLLPYVKQHPECMVVVTDDGDFAKTETALGSEFHGVRVVEGPRRGPAANRNNGAAHSKGDLLIFLDDDCTPDARLIESYQHAALQNPECSVFEGRITGVGEITGFADVSPENETGGCLWSCNIGVRRELFTAVGGFDERFPFAAMEDVDFHFRVRGRSQIKFLPQARVFHSVERRPGWRRLKHTQLSRLLYMHLHGLQPTRSGPAVYAHSIARAIAYGGLRCLKGKASRDPGFLLLQILAEVGGMATTLFWWFRSSVAAVFFPPCCSGCTSIHEVLKGNR